MKTFTLFLAVAMGSFTLARADTTLGTPITKVPYTIKKAGKYRLANDLTLTTGTVPGIAVTVPNVVIDFNGYTLAATGAANIGTNFGVDVQGVAHVTIRNGTIIGFGRAINGYGPNGGNSDSMLIEDLTCDSQIGTSQGNAALYLFGVDTTVRRCRVINPSRAYSAPTGIYANFSCLIEDCTVSDLHAQGAIHAIAYVLDDGPGDENYSAVLRQCVGSNLSSDSGSVSAVLGGAKNTLVERCSFFNLLETLGAGGNGHVIVRDTTFRACGSSPITAIDGGGNFINP